MKYFIIKHTTDNIKSLTHTSLVNPMCLLSKVSESSNILLLVALSSRNINMNCFEIGYGLKTVKAKVQFKNSEARHHGHWHYF